MGSQRNSPETTTIYIACQFIGSVPIVLNGKTRKEDISTIVDQTKSSIIFVSLNDSDKVVESTKDNKSVQKIIIFGQNETVQNENEMKQKINNKIDKLKPQNENLISLNDLKKSNEIDESKINERIVQIKPDDVSTILFTKLGSKEPKGICLNHESTIKSANLISKLIGSNENSKYLSNEPLSQLTEQLFSV